MLVTEALGTAPFAGLGQVTPAAEECRRVWGHHRPQSPVCSTVLWKLLSEMKCLWRSCCPSLLKTEL